jgi:restriction system protein
VPQAVLAPWSARNRQDRETLRKTEITRAVLCYANELGDAGLRLRREIVKRVVEWEDFSSRYPDKQLIAQGLVANVRRVVNVKDSFTQMNQEREKDRLVKQQAYQAELQERQQRQQERDEIKRNLFALFPDPQA